MILKITKNEMLLISILINDFVHKKENDLSKMITHDGVKKLKELEFRIGEIVMPRYCLPKKDKADLCKRTADKFFPKVNQE